MSHVLVLQDKYGVAWPAEAGKTAATAERLPFAEALTRIYSTDAHASAYDCASHLHRLKKEAVGEAHPTMTTLFVDADAHAAHGSGKAAAPAWWEAEKVKIGKLRAKHPGVVAYRTRGGYRLVARLATPHVVDSPAAAEAWRRWYARAIIYIHRTFDITGDPSCADFTRLFRLPHTNRGERAAENWPVVGDLAAVGAFDWSPADGDLGEDIVAAEMLSKRADVVAPQGWAGLAYLLKPKAPASPRPAMPALSPSAARIERYANAALDSAASKIASTPAGGRNGVLNSEAFSVGRLVAGGVVPESTAEAVLVAAAEAAGLAPGEARASTRSGLEAGQRHPRAIPETPFRSVGALAAAPAPGGPPVADAEPEMVYEWIPAPEPAPRPVVHEAAYYGLAGRIVNAIKEHTEADPFGILACILVMFGVVVGRRPHFIAGGERHGTNEYVALVGPTSEGRKGTAVSEAKRIFCLAGPAYTPPTASGLSSGEGFVHAIRDEVRTLRPVRDKGKVVDHEEVIEDQGVPDKRLLANEPEFASVFARMNKEGNSLSALIRQGWDGHTLSTMTIKPRKATDPHVGMIFQSTQDELTKVMTETEAFNGFGNRIQFVSVKRWHVLPFGGSPDLEVLNPLVEELREAVDVAKEVGEMKRDDEANKAWKPAYTLLTADRPGLFGSITARGAQHVIRLSMIYALLDKESEVKKVHLKAALAFWKASMASAQAIFGGLQGDLIADEILAELQERPDGMTRTEMTDLFNRNIRSSRIGAALGLLARLGLAVGRKEEPVKTAESKAGGRKVERWFYRPQPHEKNEKTQEEQGDKGGISFISSVPEEDEQGEVAS